MRIESILSLVFLIFTSCAWDVHKTFYISESVDKNWYELKKMTSGCCGCYSYYYNVYEGDKVKEQFVVELGGCLVYRPTKHFFDYDSKGGIQVKNSLVATTENNFEIEISKKDLELLEKLDSLYREDPRYASSRKVDLTEIKGYKKTKDREKIHFVFYDGLKKIKQPK